MNNISDNLIFGYGGLIFSQSRQMTLGTETQAFPATLYGFERFWGFTAVQHHLTTVSLRLNESKACVGVVFRVTPDQLKHLDKREVGYLRVKIPCKDICFWQSNMGEVNRNVYTYVTNVGKKPSLDYPITQSDIDAILTGCIQDYGEEFARQVVTTTTGWDSPWINDREAPRYPYSLHNSNYIGAIDQILDDVIGIDKRQQNH